VIVSKCKFNFEKWSPYTMDTLSDDQYDILRSQYEQLMWLVPAETLRVWREDFETEMLFEASEYSRRVKDHWVRS